MGTKPEPAKEGRLGPTISGGFTPEPADESQHTESCQEPRELWSRCVLIRGQWLVMQVNVEKGDAVSRSTVKEWGDEDVFLPNRLIAAAFETKCERDKLLEAAKLVVARNRAFDLDSITWQQINESWDVLRAAIARCER